jgi:hypothetical protein
MLLVIVSCSPVPKLTPGPVSYFQLVALGAVPDVPSKSSRQRSENPAGGAAVTSAGEPAVAPAVTSADEPAAALADAAPPDGVEAVDPQAAAASATALPIARAEMRDRPRRRRGEVVCECFIS